MKTVVYSIILSLLCTSVAIASVRILTTEEPPTNYTVHGELTGITTDIVEAIKKRLNIETKIEVLPWARAFKIAKTERNTLIFTAGRSPERTAHGFHFIGPVVTRTHSLWSKSDSNFNITLLEDISKQQLRIGAMRGDWREKYFSNLGFEVDKTTDHYMSLRMLLIGRFNLMVSSDLEAPQVAKELDIDANKIKMAFPFLKSSSYLIMSRDTPKTTVNLWNKAFTELQETDFFEKTAEKWSVILGYELGYSKDKGIYAK